LRILSKQSTRSRNTPNAGEEVFRSEDLIQVWIIHHIQIIGEACRSLSSTFRDEHPEVPWTDIVNMRNVLVHHYFGIDKDQVWNVVENELTPLKAQVQTLLGGMAASTATTDESAER
jgi:uncharacterized protein with HEPN domain